jgi:hypothetical protein
MKKIILTVLFFGGLWGLSEAVLGGYLYRVEFSWASVPLTMIGFIFLTLAYRTCPRLGVATLIAAFAMLYKFLNTPFFGCHLLGILLLGASWDICFHLVKMKSKALQAALAVYLGHALFALSITYLFRYEHWVQAGFSKVIYHIGVTGTITALVCAFAVLLTFRVNLPRMEDIQPTGFRKWFAPAALSISTTAIWVFGITAYLMQ